MKNNSYYGEKKAKCPVCGKEFWKQAVINHIHAKDHWGDNAHRLWIRNHKKPTLTRECGNANGNGNVALTYKGGCRKTIDIEDAYRCTGCGGWFHKDCVIKHFKLERDHDWGRREERERIIKILEKYFAGLILIPYPEKTILNIIKKINL